MRWEDILTDRLDLPMSFDSAPWTPFTKPLAHARIAVMTTGGRYTWPTRKPSTWTAIIVPGDSPGYSAGGLPCTPHTHYDTNGVAEDVDAVFAIHRLQELADEGHCRPSAHSPTYSFMGYIRDVAGLMEVTAPDAAQRLKADGVDGVVIGTT